MPEAEDALADAVEHALDDEAEEQERSDDLRDTLHA